MSEEEIRQVKRMDLQEFMEFGFLHEVNRLCLHPMGLALEIIFDKDPETGVLKNHKLGGIWDYRDDPEGLIFQKLDPEKMERVREHCRKKTASREEHLGYIIQTKDAE